jgi:imidazolonepropionase-like amidohydrolase
MEAIVARPATTPTRSASKGQVGEIAAGKLADIIVLNKDPIADITVLQAARTSRG